jgi:hypothetical protein
MTSNVRRLPFLCAGLLITMMLSSAAFADRDQTHVGNDISVGPDEEVGDATCFGCSIRVRGHVTGDVTVFGGSVVVEDQGQVGGDATVFGGDIRIDKEAKIARDVTVFGGRIRRDSASAVGGSVTTMGGPGWMFLIFLIPFIFLGGFVALIVWLIRRLMRPSVPAPA